MNYDEDRYELFREYFKCGLFSVCSLSICTEIVFEVKFSTVEIAPALCRGHLQNIIISFELSLSANSASS